MVYLIYRGFHWGELAGLLVSVTADCTDNRAIKFRHQTPTLSVNQIGAGQPSTHLPHSKRWPSICGAVLRTT